MASCSAQVRRLRTGVRRDEVELEGPCGVVRHGLPCQRRARRDDGDLLTWPSSSSQTPRS